MTSQCTCTNSEIRANNNITQNICITNKLNNSSFIRLFYTYAIFLIGIF